MRADFPTLREEFSKGQLPPEIIDRLDEILVEAGHTPLIVRSSSLLEDNFGTSFAGKYESIFLPNQGTYAKKMAALTSAISRIYASVMDPDALLYRHHKDLADYDERIAILIQFVEGQQMGKYYLPHAAGVAFSHNLYRWSPQIREDEGFLRLVLGLGTRAVDLVADDCPRLVALSHPRLQPSSDIRSARRYSQQNVDVIDLEKNQMVTVPMKDVLASNYPPLRYAVQIEQDGYLANLLSKSNDYEKMVITFDALLARTSFAKNIREALKLLEVHYESPVDTEFTVKIIENDTQKPDIQFTLLQCRPQSHINSGEEVQLPNNLKPEDIVFSTQRMVPQGIVHNIRYILFVTSEGYFSLTSQAERTLLERAIGQLNIALKDEIYIAVGPGRWGTSTPDLGVHVSYSDIFHARSLIELAGEAVGASPEPSFGTHFFQDLMEAKIYPLAVFLDDEDTIFNRDFFYVTPNRVLDFISIENPRVLDALRLITVSDYRPNHSMDLVMDGHQSRAVAFLVSENTVPPESFTTSSAPAQLE